MITVCSARLSYGGPGRLDITRSNAWKARQAGCVADGELFAPEVDLLSAVRASRIIVDEYFARYRAQLERINKAALRSILNGVYGDRLVGVCFCPPRDGVLTCHRTIWREFMVARGAIEGGELPTEEQRAARRPRPTQGRLF